MAQVRFAPSHELRSLNKRLAVYIDRVHGMEEKENRLNQAIENAMKTAEREMTKQKGVYERELADSRSRIGEMTKENAKLQLDSKKIGMELDKFKAELEALNHK